MDHGDLPSGVVSKKDMGDLRILMSIVLCNNEAAFNVNTLQTYVKNDPCLFLITGSILPIYTHFDNMFTKKPIITCVVQFTIFCQFKLYAADGLPFGIKTWQRRVAPMMLRDCSSPRTP